MASHIKHATDNTTLTVSVGEKAGAIVTLAGLTLISSILLPLVVRKRILSTSEKGLSGCLCFGAGVLLATVFLHLLPDVHNDIEEAISESFMPDTEFPIPELIICCGFFLVYLVEEIVHLFFPHGHDGHIISLDLSEDNSKNINIIDRTSTANRVSTGIDNSAFESNSNPSIDNIEDHGNGGTTNGENTSMFRAMIIVAAFSFHSLMEGMAIGLEKTSFGLWLLIAVVCAHKLVVGFSLGMELLQEGLKKAPFIGAMVTFSLCSPLGGVIGTIIIENSNKTAAGILVPTVLNGLAGGCILFVAFCEVLERERSKPHGPMLKLISMMAGFAIMCGLESIPE